MRNPETSMTLEWARYCRKPQPPAQDLSAITLCVPTSSSQLYVSNRLTVFTIPFKSHLNFDLFNLSFRCISMFTIDVLRFSGLPSLSFHPLIISYNSADKSENVIPIVTDHQMTESETDNLNRV